MGYRWQQACDPQTFLQRARLVVTGTVAKSPLFSAEQLMPGTHITAVGADSAGKQELDPWCFARAACIATDDHNQCLAFGEFGVAVRAGAVTSDSDLSLGAILEGDVEVSRDSGQVTFAGLTRVAAQDIPIPSYA